MRCEIIMDTKKESVKSTKPAKKDSAAAASGDAIPYHQIIATCACGGEFKTGSTQEVVRVDICSNCHPFFTGEQRLLDTEGRIEKFRKKFNRPA